MAPSMKRIFTLWKMLTSAELAKRDGIITAYGMFTIPSVQMTVAVADTDAVADTAAVADTDDRDWPDTDDGF